METTQKPDNPLRHWLPALGWDQSPRREANLPPSGGRLDGSTIFASTHEGVRAGMSVDCGTTVPHGVG
jgi:hypothetical protein